MKLKLFLFIVSGCFLTSCSEKAEHNSRQFKGEFSIQGLTNNEEEIEVSGKYFYEFYSDSIKYFDTSGYFKNKKDSSNLNFEPVFYQSTREVLEKYTLSALDSIKPNNLEEEIFKISRKYLSTWSNEKIMKVQLNALIIDIQK